MNEVSLQMNANTAGRPPVKQEGLIDDLRGKIVNGTYAPGERLPSVRALEKQYKASRATIQRVLDSVKEDGFIQTRVGSGTRVVAHPPHLCRYGIVMPGHRRGTDWTNYYETLHQSAEDVLGKPTGASVVLHDGINGPLVNRAYAELLRDVECQRCAGLIFAVPPFMLADSPVLTTTGMPRVVVGLPEVWQGCSSVSPDARALERRALRHFRDAGCRRLAVIIPATPSLKFKERWQHFRKLAGRNELTLHEHWLQGVDLHTPDWTRNVARLLFHDGRDERPDALLVLDDNLIQAVTDGVEAAGVKTAGDLLIISHANFPNLPKTALPVTWLGFDITQLMREAKRLIDAQRTENAAPEVVKLKPVFQEELEDA